MTSNAVAKDLRRARAATRQRIAEANRMEPVDHQRQHNVILDMKRSRAAVLRVVQCPLDRYQKRRIITMRQHTAGVKLRDDYELGVLGARDPEAGGGSGPLVGLSVAQILAAEAYRLALRAIGRRLVPVVIGVVCEEKSVEHMADVGALDRRQLMGVLKLGLDSLADHYGHEDDSVHVEVIGDAGATLVYRLAPGGVVGVKLDGRLWTRAAESMAELRRLAHETLRRVSV